MSVGPLDRKVALVTGASRGIGEAVARRFAADGATVAATARTVEEGDHPLRGSIAATVRAITDAGGVAVAVAADLARPEDRARLLEQLVPAELHEPVEVMAEAAHALCSGDPATLTGRVAFSQPLLAELGLSVPTGP